VADIHIKRGASLILSMQLLNADGSNFAIDPLSVVSCGIADIDGNLVDMPPLTQPAGTVGVLTLEVDATAAWPLGQLRADVTIQSYGTVAISESFPIYVDPPAVYQ
jgi:hypothetical protein